MAIDANSCDLWASMQRHADELHRGSGPWLRGLNHRAVAARLIWR